MPYEQLETRYAPDAILELREAGGTTPPVIAGYAATWNTVSQDLGHFYERLETRPFTEYLSSRSSDVIANINHDRSGIPLARYLNGRGTLTLQEDSKGLYMEFTAPKTAQGEAVVEAIRRGDLRGMSFSFVAQEENWSERYNKKPMRTIRKAALRDVAIVTNPAYSKTEIAIRSHTDSEILTALSKLAMPEEDRDALGCALGLLMAGQGPAEYEPVLRKYSSLTSDLISKFGEDTRSSSCREFAVIDHSGRFRQLALIRQQLTDDMLS